MAEGILVAPGAGEPFFMGPIGSGEIKIGAGATNDMFCVWELTMALGGPQVPAHLHHKIHEFCFVLAGELNLTVGDQTQAVGPGTFCYLPPGVVHAFSHIVGERARVLVVGTPAGMLEAVLRAGRGLFAAGPPDAAKMSSVYTGLDIEFPDA